MKKTSTWYSFALAAFNVGLGIGTSEVANVWVGAYRQLEVKIPGITELALTLSWWPYLFAGFAILLALISIASQWPSNRFYHFFIMSLVLECFILIMGQIIFALPIIGITTLR